MEPLPTETGNKNRLEDKKGERIRFKNGDSHSDQEKKSRGKIEMGFPQTVVTQCEIRGRRGKKEKELPRSDKMQAEHNGKAFAGRKKTHRKEA